MNWSLLQLLLLLGSMQCANGHQKIYINLPTMQVRGQVHQMLPIRFGKDMLIHTAATTIPEDENFLVVHPATVYPVPNHFSFENGYSVGFVLPTTSPTLLEELRTYRSARYCDMVICEGLIYLQLFPNKIVVVREDELHNFKLENEYILEDINEQSVTKMYAMGKGKDAYVLMVVQNSNTFYRLRVQQFQKLTIEQQLTIHHLWPIDSTHLVAATGSSGVILYSISTNAVKVKHIFSCQDLNITSSGKDADSDSEIQIKSECMITDLSLNFTSSIAYVLDSKSGLYKYQFQEVQTDERLLLQGGSQISSIKDCQALDLVSSEYFVLVCQVGMPNSYIQQLIQFPDPILPNKTVIVKKEPIYHNCNFNDLVVTPDYFLFFDSYTIDIYWNSIRTGSFVDFSNEHSKQHFNIAGLQVFSLQIVNGNIYLYVVESGKLIKYNLITFEGDVFVYSPIPVQKDIKIHVPCKCNSTDTPILTNNREINQNSECFYQLKVQLQIQIKSEQAHKQKVSLSIGLILLMLAMVFILVWICLMKYRALEMHARRILHRYQERNRYHDNKFNI